MTMSKTLDLSNNEIKIYEHFVELIRRGCTGSAFRYINEEINAYNKFDGETPEERDVCREFVRRRLIYIMTSAVKSILVCCGHSPEVRGVYNVENKEHSLFMYCGGCGANTKIRGGKSQ